MSSFLVKNFLKYSVVFSENSKGDAAYLLKEGRVEISKIVEGKKKVFAILKPVALFGEMAILLDDEKRTATAVALEDSKVVEIKKEDFEEYIRQSPPIIATLLNVLVHRLKTATQKSLRVPNLFLGITSLLSMFSKQGVRKLNYLDTVSNLANAFNTNAESVEKAFEILAGDGLVNINAEDGEKSIGLLDPDQFAAKTKERRKGKAEVQKANLGM